MLTSGITVYKTINSLGPHFSHLKKKHAGLCSFYHLVWTQMSINFWWYSLWYGACLSFPYCLSAPHLPLYTFSLWYSSLGLCKPHFSCGFQFLVRFLVSFQLDSLYRRHWRETARLFFAPWTTSVLYIAWQLVLISSFFKNSHFYSPLSVFIV